MEFGLLFFGTESGGGDDAARVVLECTKIADDCGLKAVWTPERHFHDFGGPFPNPAVLGAALAVLTDRVRIRAGSVVLPLHDPVRVAEEWAVVDTLSGGRVDVSFASGWHSNDFVLAPRNYDDRRAVMLEGIDTVRRLWRGETVERLNGSGIPTPIAIFPRPVQPELPFWVTSSGKPQTFEMAGELGANVLTHMLGQSAEALGRNIGRYRKAFTKARLKHGRAGQGHVSLMLHTYLGADADEVRRKVRGPLCDYLGRSMDLTAGLNEKAAPGLRISSLSAHDRAFLVARAFDRYFESDGLFGSPQMALERVLALADLGVDEIACLVDFGLGSKDVLDGLAQLVGLTDSV